MNIDSKLKEVLSGVDVTKISESKKTIEQLLNTPEGRKVAQQLGNIDKNKLMSTFMSMDTQELKRKLQNADLSELSKLKADEIINKLK